MWPVEPCQENAEYHQENAECTGTVQEGWLHDDHLLDFGSAS